MFATDDLVWYIRENCETQYVGFAEAIIAQGLQKGITPHDLADVLVKIVPGITHENLDPFFVERDPSFSSDAGALDPTTVETMKIPLSQGTLTVSRKTDKAYPGVSISFDPKGISTEHTWPLAVIDECTHDGNGNFGLMAALYNAGEKEPAMAPFKFRLTPPKFYVKELLKVAVNRGLAGLCSYNRVPHFFIKKNVEDVGDMVLVAVPWLSDMWDAEKGRLIEVTTDGEKEFVAKAVFWAILAEAQEKGTVDNYTAEQLCWSLADILDWAWDVAPF